MESILQDVAIIGAGLGGCALALALSAQEVAVTLYESRPQRSDVLKSGVILTPNGLWVLDKLDVFDRIKDRCFKATHRVYKNDKDETTKKTLIADESLYGYRNHRIWRKLLLDEMKLMLSERSVPIHYDSRFNGIVSDTSDGVSFRINDTNHTASLLIGSDGIYSTVRDAIAPGIEPEYTGTVGVLSHIKRDSVAWPYDDYEWNATIQGKPGAFFFVPEDPQGEDIMIGTQVQYPEQSKQDLENLQSDHDKLVEFYRRDYDEHGPTAQSIIDRITENKESCFIWPYLRMPELPQWYASSGRVLIVGDGAHALPPSSGQGVNQALEDAYSLTLMLTSGGQTAGKTNGARQNGSEKSLKERLAFWQQMRQKRIDAIFDWATNSQNVERLPEAERKKRIEEGKAKQSDDMSWLYEPTLEKEVTAFLNGS